MQSSIDMIKAKGLNGFSKPDVKPEPAPNDNITVEIIVSGNKYTGKLNKV